MYNSGCKSQSRELMGSRMGPPSPVTFADVQAVITLMLPIPDTAAGCTSAPALPADAASDVSEEPAVVRVRLLFSRRSRRTNLFSS